MKPRVILEVSVLCALALCLAACLSGGEPHHFDAYAAGPADAQAGQPYTFQTGRGYDVTLTRATLHVSALHLNRSRPTSVGSSTNCMLPGIYTADVTSSLDVDVLSPELQPFPERSFADTDRASIAEVWLSGDGDINDPEQAPVILDVAGTARGEGPDIPFAGKITIGKNRVIEPPSPAAPGANPICKQRIVPPIPAKVNLTPGKDLILRIDPRGLFADVDFSALEPSSTSPPLYLFRDDDGDAPSRQLYLGLRAAQGTYFVSAELLGPEVLQ